MKQFTIGRVGLVLLATGTVCLGQAAVASASAPPTLSWSSSSGSLDYGTVDAGQTPSLTFTLTNSGGSATGALKVSLPSSAFLVTSDTCTGTSLGPSKSCTVTVQYTPATSSDSAVLTASSKKASANATLTGSKNTRQSQAQIDCVNFGGTYATGTIPGDLWTCDGWTGTQGSGVAYNTLVTDCFNEGGNSFASVGYGVTDSTCSS